MRSWFRTGWLAVLALGLSACGAAAAQAQSATAGTPAPSSASNTELTDTARLMLGTMKLDEVGLQPDATEAGQLLPLWQAYQAVITSDTAAPAEAEAVLKQIRSTMTPEQLTAIDAMKLTQDDVRSLFEEFRQTASQNGGGSTGGFTPGQGGPPPGFAPPDGGRAFGGGGFGGGGFSGGGAFSGGGGSNGGGFTPEQRATAEARRSNGNSGSRSAQFLLRPLIAELQTLAGS